MPTIADALVPERVEHILGSGNGTFDFAVEGEVGCRDRDENDDPLDSREYLMMTPVSPSGQSTEPSNDE